MTAGPAYSPFSPQTFASSDVDLEHRLANFLYQRNVPDGDCVRLDARGGVVIVSGELPTQHAKWLCIECCRRVAGVLKVVDELTVALPIVKFPNSSPAAAELKRYSHGSYTSNCSGKRPLRRVAASKSAARSDIAASQHARLLAAA
jgi:hypothetical protein